MSDLNGDGHLDLATVNEGLSTVSVLLGDGRGGFSAATNFSVSDQDPIDAQGPQSL